MESVGSLISKLVLEDNCAITSIAISIAAVKHIVKVCEHVFIIVVSSQKKQSKDNVYATFI